MEVLIKMNAKKLLALARKELKTERAEKDKNIIKKLLREIDAAEKISKMLNKKLTSFLKGKIKAEEIGEEYDREVYI